MRKTLITTTLLTLGTFGLIAAAPAADLNQDGQVTQAEFAASALNKFIAADTNADGFLDATEREGLKDNRRAERSQQRFDKMDTNGDGAVTYQEITDQEVLKRATKEARRDERKTEMLEKYDTNMDGELSKSERTVLRAESKEMREARSFRKADGERPARADGERRKGPHAGGEGRRGPRGDKAGRPKLDTNEDGLISKAEYMAMSDALFARMDANGDGALVKGEGREHGGKKKKGFWRR